MIEYRQALGRILARAPLCPSERIPLADALGRILAVDIHARESIPPFHKAAMDGYAVRATDTVFPGGRAFVELPVTEDLPAGRISRRGLKPGQAARIMTGAALPRGADAVVMVEDTKDVGPGVHILRTVKKGENTGKAGEDVKKGETPLKKGMLVGPAEIGMLAALGSASVRVRRRPKVAVIATGDEIAEPGARKGPGHIWNSNGYSLLALARQAGADPVYQGIARDSRSALKGKIRKSEGADILVISGGVSVGDHDLVRDQLCDFGVEPVFWKVSVKPGKPVFFGVKRKQLVFGLPGNPTSAMVTFLFFVRPAIDKMLGQKTSEMRTGKAILDKGIDLKPGRTQFLRGRITSRGPLLRAALHPNQKSGVLKSMVESDILVIVPPKTSRLEKGQEVDVLFMG